MIAHILFSVVDLTDVKQMKLCIQQHRVIEHELFCPSAMISCSKGTILIDRHDFKTLNENCTWPCEALPFNDTSTFPNIIDEKCSFNQQCNLNGIYINGSLQAEWIAEIQFFCLAKGKTI